jgi:hypothetical protein
MMVLLSDLHGMSIASLLGLDKYQVNYVQKCDLSAWTKRDMSAEVRRNFKVYHDCFLVHHETKHGLRKQMPGVSGHSHKHLAWSFESPTWGAYEWHQLGCMHIRDATYTDAERWSVGFALVHIDTEYKRTQIEYVTVGETMAVVGGKYFLRDSTVGKQKAIGHQVAGGSSHHANVTTGDPNSGVPRHVEAGQDCGSPRHPPRRRPCEICGRPLHSRGSKRRFCSTECYARHRCQKTSREN